MNRPLLILSAWASLALAAPSLPEAYREAKAALEAGNPARAVELLAPVMAGTEGDETQRALAGLALGIAHSRTEKPELAIPLLEASAARWAGTAEAANALAPLGDALRKAGKPTEARRAYEQAAAAAKESVLGRYSSARLSELSGEILAAEKRYTQAAAAYLSAADALLAIGPDDAAYFADAKALYIQVAQAKEWRGEPTARAVFSIGEVERAQGRLPEAIAYYQRTFVSWLRYPQWCARAYLRAAECFDKLGKREFAIRHLREMQRKQDKFSKLPEFEKGMQQLRDWGMEVR